MGKDVAVIVLHHMLAAYHEGKQISLHKLSYNKNDMVVNKDHYKSMLIKQSFDIRNTLLHQPDVIDTVMPKHSLSQYDELMGSVTL